MRLVHRFINWFFNSRSHPKRAPDTVLDQAHTTAPNETPNAAVSGGDSREVPLRFYVKRSPETPLAALLRDGEIAPNGSGDSVLERHGTWVPTSHFYFSSGATAYYNRSLEKWLEIDQDDLLEYLKELRGLVEAPLEPSSFDLDEAIQRTERIRALQKTRSARNLGSRAAPEETLSIDYFDEFFQKQFDRALTFVLNTLNAPKYRGLTIKHLLSMHKKGYKSIAEILDAPDEVLLSVSGIGPKRVETIRSNLSKSIESSPEMEVVSPGMLATPVRAPSGASTGIPPLNVYFPSTAIMDAEQRAFYDHVERELGGSRRVEVGEDIGYLYVYLYKVLEQKEPETIVQDLQRIQSLYKDNNKISFHCAMWISDTYAKAARYEEALRAFPKLQIGSRSGIPTSKKLSLRLAVGSEVEPIEILTLFGPKVTKFVRDQLSLVERYIGILLAEHERRDHKGLLSDWAEHSKKAPYGYPAYDGTTVPNAQILELPFYWFSASRYIEEFCLEVTRDAENAIRGDRGLPGVGEGWISETRLYYEVKEALSDRKVVHHASPDWLGRQHLDIFLPEILVAIEYQGAQHDRPIEFFGGVKVFEENIRRDRRKKRLCEENGVCLIYVREGYVLEEVVEAIRTRSGVGGGVP